MENIKNQLNKVSSYINKYEHIFVYGAGVFAKIYCDCLKELGITPEAFVVTNKSENIKGICDIPVIQIDEVHTSLEQTVFIIATNPENSIEIEDIIKKYSYTNVISLEKETFYISEIEKLRRTVTAIEVTTRIGCAVNCKYCPQQLLVRKYFSKNKKRKQILSLEDYKICLNHLPKDAVITFSGFTEPFLNPECADMILITADNGNKMSLHTTLRGLTLEGLDKIKDIKFEYVTVHLPDKDGYADIPLTDEYMKVLDKILDLNIKEEISWKLKANCQSEPLDKIIELIDRRMTYYKIHKIDRAGNLTDEDIHENIQWEGSIYCPKSPELMRNILLPDGSLALCCMDFGLEHIIGNLIDNSYEEIRKEKSLHYIKDAMNSDDGYVICRRCSIARRNRNNIL